MTILEATEVPAGISVAFFGAKWQRPLAKLEK